MVLTESLNANRQNCQLPRMFVFEFVLVLIPMKVVGVSDLIPVTRSDAMPVTVGAKRRWRPYRA